MNKQLLLINDLAGYGKVALSVMLPVLSHMHVACSNLPTALVSNTLDYGKFDILDTTDYMENSLKIWQELGFKYDAVATGFITSERQVDLITNNIKNILNKDALVLVDPIMGDEGKLYPGMDESRIDLMRKLVMIADYALPNFTESCLISKHAYREDMSDSEIKEIIDDFRTLGSKSVIITSVVANGKYMVFAYDHLEKRYFKLEYNNIPVRLPGTGDIFSSVLLGSLLNGHNLETSIKEAMETVSLMINLNKDNQDLFKGVEIETSLKELKHA